MFVMILSRYFRPSVLRHARCVHGGVADLGYMPKPDYGPMEVRRTAIMNGINIACAKPLGAPISACTIMYQAGSRFELDDDLGANHFLRNISNASGNSYSGFTKVRVVQQQGCSITCSSDRQTISYTLRCPVLCFAELKKFLLDSATRCCYYQHEMDDRRDFMHDELFNMAPEQRCLDLIQTASFRGPLRNSIFCNPNRINTMDEETLNCYASTYFKSDACSIGCVGIPFDEAMQLAEMMDAGQFAPPPRQEYGSCHRAGFEHYDLGPNSDTWVAIAVPGCGTLDLCCLYKHAIIAAACGVGDMQAGQHGLDRTPMTPLGALAGADVYTQFRAFNISYKETGLFGILVKSKAATAWKATMTAADFLRGVGNLDYKQLQIGKNRLKVSLALHDEDCALVAEGLALQLANKVQIDSNRDSLDIIDRVGLDEITCAAKNLASKCGQMSVAVVGDISAVPHDREIVCR